MCPVLSRLGLAALMACCSLSLGCPPSVYRSETTLNDNGSIERAVYQLVASMPEASKKANLWQQTTYAPDPVKLKDQKFMGAIRELPIREADKERPYFAAWGRFMSPNTIPDHYVRKAPENSGLADSKLVRTYERLDHVLVVEHRWSETLTESITQEGMRKARDDLADVCIAVFADTFDKAYGQDWDAAGLVEWLKTEAKPWWAEITDYHYLLCLNHKTWSARERLDEGLRSISARHGLVLPTPAPDKTSKDDQIERALTDFALTVLCKHVRHKKDGKLVDPRTAMQWLEDFKKNQEQDKPPPVWLKALGEVVEAKYGGKEALLQKAALLLVQMLGPYYFEALFLIFSTFEYTMTVPGDVIETNGEVVSPGKVRWQFLAMLAYPQGYAMTVQSLSLDKALQKELLKGEPLNDLKVRRQFVFVMKWAPESLREAVRECRKHKSLAPLEAFKLKATPPEQEWVDRLISVLKPPMTTPNK